MASSSSSSSSSSSKVWNGIMQAEVSPTCKGLAWSAYREELPVNMLLREKGVIEDATCPCCGETVETTTHAFLLCVEVKPIWFASPMGFRVESFMLHNNFITLPQWIHQCVDVLDKEAMGMVCAILWALWHKRNAWCVLHKKLDCTQVIEKVMSACKKKEEGEERCWFPPPPPYVKVNFASLVDYSEGTGMGVIFRDSSQETLASATVSLEEIFEEAEIGEAVCYRWAIGLAKELGYSDVIFETDCYKLYSKCNRLRMCIEAEGDREFESVVKECLNTLMTNGTRSSHLSLAPCSANKVAVGLATLAFNYPGQRVWMGKLSKKVDTLLESDLVAFADLLKL